MAMFKKGDNWYIDYYALNRRKREKIGPSKKLAEDVLHKRKIEIAENKYLDIHKQEKIKFNDFAKTYFETYSKPNKKSSRKDASILKRLCRHFGNRYLYEINSFAIEKFKTECAQEVSPATVNRHLACLKHMYTKAIEWGRAHENPAKKVKLFKENNKRFRYLDKEEIDIFLKSCSDDFRPIVIVALNTGMRKSEILNLKWQDVDFKNNIIYLFETKNSEKREIPMNDMTKRALLAVRKRPDSPYIFINSKGEHWRDIRKSFFTALKKSGIIAFRFHDLRHTFASQLVMSGVDLNTVRELLGHKSIEMTLRYSHLSPNHKKRAVDVLGRKMDTIWTPTPITSNDKEEHPLHKLLIDKELKV